jgi:tripartite-type tricarboxylate transporter receptor subunit TctC
MASSGIGSPNHMSGELFKAMTGVGMVHVPYRGGAPALGDLLAGQVQVTFSPMPSSIEYIRGARLRALAVTTASRWPALPDIPTIAEFVPGYETSTWTGIGVPRGTPAEIVDRLNEAINAGFADPRLLRARRPEVYARSGDSRPQPSNFILNLTLQERLARLERLGLPVPVIETDYEDQNAPAQSADHP